MDKIKRYLKLSKSFFDEAVNFIKHQFLKWETEIDNKDKILYYFAGLIMLLQEKQMYKEEELLLKYIKECHTNISIDKLNIALERIREWCEDRGNHNPFDSV